MARPMTRKLAEALDGLSASNRRVLRRLAHEQQSSTWLGRLLDGLAAECAQMELDEMEVLAALEADRRADLDRIDLEVNGPAPQITEGEAWWPDVDSGRTP